MDGAVNSSWFVSSSELFSARVPGCWLILAKEVLVSIADHEVNDNR